MKGTPTQNLKTAHLGAQLAVTFDQDALLVRRPFASFQTASEVYARVVGGGGGE